MGSVRTVIFGRCVTSALVILGRVAATGGSSERVIDGAEGQYEPSA